MESPRPPRPQLLLGNASLSLKHFLRAGCLSFRQPVRDGSRNPLSLTLRILSMMFPRVHELLSRIPRSRGPAPATSPIGDDDGGLFWAVCLTRPDSRSHPSRRFPSLHRLLFLHLHLRLPIRLRCARGVPLFSRGRTLVVSRLLRLTRRSHRRGRSGGRRRLLDQAQLLPPKLQWTYLCRLCHSRLPRPPRRASSRVSSTTLLEGAQTTLHRSPVLPVLGLRRRRTCRRPRTRPRPSWNT